MHRWALLTGIGGDRIDSSYAGLATACAAGADGEWLVRSSGADGYSR